MKDLKNLSLTDRLKELEYEPSNEHCREYVKPYDHTIDMIICINSSGNMIVDACLNIWDMCINELDDINDIRKAYAELEKDLELLYQ